MYIYINTYIYIYIYSVWEADLHLKRELIEKPLLEIHIRIRVSEVLHFGDKRYNP